MTQGKVSSPDWWSRIPLKEIQRQNVLLEANGILERKKEEKRKGRKGRERGKREGERENMRDIPRDPWSSVVRG